MEVLPNECVFKADQWVMLSRFHALLIIKMVEYFYNLPDGPQKRKRSFNFQNIFNQTRASDELFFPCSLALLGFLPAHPPTISKSNGSDETEKGDVHVEAQKINNQDFRESKQVSESEREGAKADSQRVDLEAIGPIIKKRLTFVDWSLQESSPKTFPYLDTELISTAQNQGCILIRKINVQKIPGEHAESSRLSWFKSLCVSSGKLPSLNMTPEYLSSRYNDILASVESETFSGLVKENKKRKFFT